MPFLNLFLWGKSFLGFFLSSSCCQAVHETGAHLAAGWRCSVCAVQPQPETASCFFTGLHCESFLHWHAQGMWLYGLWGTDNCSLEDEEYVGKMPIYCRIPIMIKERLCIPLLVLADRILTEPWLSHAGEKICFIWKGLWTCIWQGRSNSAGRMVCQSHVEL